MADCEDGDDASDASIADLREDLASVADAFQEEAQRNVQDRADGEPVAESFGLAAAHFDVRQDPFNPEPVLLFVHDGDDQKRPLLRRPEAEGDGVPPVNSESIEVGTDALEPNTEHAIECTVTNLGGRPARNVTVELFAEHYEPDARIDTTGDELLMEREYGAQIDQTTFDYTGVTTMAPGTHVSAFAHMDDGGPPFENILGYSVDAVVQDDRTFTGYVNGKPDEFVDGGSVPDSDEFTLEVYDTTLARYSAVGPGGTPFWEDPDNWDGIRLASVDGRFVNDPGDPADRKEQYLASTVEASETTRIGKQTTAIAGGGASTVTFQHAFDDLPPGRAALGPEDGQDGEDDPGAGRAVTALYARAYSLGDSEVPDDWSALDHTSSRFCSRTDVPRRS